MQTVQNLIPGKNALWLEYSMSFPLVHDQIIADLKAVNLYRHWQQVASKEGYDLKMAKAPLRDIFLKHMPETAHHFGIELQPTNSQTA